MTSNRPYLIRALYEWITDNGLTPYLLVDAEAAEVQVPRQYVQEGRIVLNINPTAVQGLRLGNDWVEFNARFSGSPHQVNIPTPAVMAIYARENGQGMVFGNEPGGDQPPPSAPEPTTPQPAKRPTLKIVK
jgi:stringent starvation protein B